MLVPPRLLFFGPPHSGKSSLVGVALRQLGSTAAVEPSHGRVLVPYAVAVRHPSVPGGPLVVCDCDGQAAGELLAHPDALVRRSAGELADAVRTVDALVLVVDAAATAEEVDATFRGFGAVLATLEETRIHDREAGGLPIFLTLAKCDAIFQPDDEPADWLARIERRTAEVRNRFDDFFADRVVEEFGFGTLAVRTAETALAVPPGPMFAPYADPDGSFGIAALLEDLVPAARLHRDRVDRTRRRLKATLGGVGVLVTTMAAALLGMLALGGDGDPLARRIREMKRADPPPSVRFADPNRARSRKELLALRQNPGFASLPAELRSFVDGRLAELDAYAAYRAKFDPPRLGPSEMRTAEELNALAASLDGELAPPAAFADTPAAKLFDKWRTDVDLVREAEGRLFEFLGGRIRAAHQLALVEQAPGPAWRSQVEAVVREGDAPPFPSAGPIPGSPTVPGPRGEPLSYATPFAFDRIDLARREWADARGRLLHLRDLCDAVGLTTGPGTPPAVLDLPEGAPLDAATLRLRDLAAFFPAADPQRPEWSTANFPDPARRWLEPRLRIALENGLRTVRSHLSGKLAGDRADDWKKLADAALRDPAVQDWGTLLGRLRRWLGTPAASADPVRELAAFLAADSFPMKLSAVEVTIPDDLLDARAVPAGNLAIRIVPAVGEPREFALRPVGDGVRERPVTVYRFVAEKPIETQFRPGEEVTATVPLRTGTAEYRLTWSGGRSAVYSWDALSRPPTLAKIGPLPTPVRVNGVNLTASPPEGWPSVPALLPEVRGR